jgi:hypothetical protein
LRETDRERERERNEAIKREIDRAREICEIYIERDMRSLQLGFVAMRSYIMPCMSLYNL